MHKIFTGQMPFLTPNHQHQSTEGQNWWIRKRTKPAGTILGWSQCSELPSVLHAAGWVTQRKSVCISYEKVLFRPIQLQKTRTFNKLAIAVADRSHDALHLLKSYQLLCETQLPQTECAMMHVTISGCIGLINCAWWIWHRLSCTGGTSIVARSTDDSLALLIAARSSSVVDFNDNTWSHRPTMAKFSKPRVWDKVPEGSNLSFGVIWISSIT